MQASISSLSSSSPPSASSTVIINSTLHDDITSSHAQSVGTTSEYFSGDITSSTTTAPPHALVGGSDADRGVTAASRVYGDYTTGVGGDEQPSLATSTAMRDVSRTVSNALHHLTNTNGADHTQAATTAAPYSTAADGATTTAAATTTTTATATTVDGGGGILSSIRSSVTATTGHDNVQMTTPRMVMSTNTVQTTMLTDGDDDSTTVVTAAIVAVIIVIILLVFGITMIIYYRRRMYKKQVQSQAEDQLNDYRLRDQDRNDRNNSSFRREPQRRSTRSKRSQHPTSGGSSNSGFYPDGADDKQTSDHPESGNYFRKGLIAQQDMEAYDELRTLTVDEKTGEAGQDAANGTGKEHNSANRYITRKHPNHAEYPSTTLKLGDNRQSVGPMLIFSSGETSTDDAYSTLASHGTFKK